MLGWGAAAFGANYAWAYQPLLAASAILGAAALLAGRASITWSLVAALALVGAAGTLQLVPLHPDVLAQISPRAIIIHQQRHLLAAVGGVSSYSITIDPERTKLGLAFLGALGLFAAGGARLLSRYSARSLAVAISSIGAALALIALLQRASFNGRIYGFWELTQGGSPFGPFVNRNHFAGWMLMAFPVTVGLFTSLVSRGVAGGWRSARDRVAWLASAEANKVILAGFAMLAMATSLALTFSRSGMVAITAAMMFASIVMIRRRAGGGRLWVPACLLFVAITAVSWVGIDRIAARFAAPGTIDSDGRRAIWIEASNIVRDFWLTGTGLNTFGIASIHYQPAFTNAHVREAHNDYLQLAAEGGLLLGVPILIAIGSFIRAVRGRLRADEGSPFWIRMGAITGLFAIAVQSLVDFSLQMPGNAALFAALCAIALHDGRRGRRHVRATTEVKAGERRQAPQHAPPTRSEKIVAFANPQPRLTFAFDDQVPVTRASQGELNSTDLDAPGLLEHAPARPPFGTVVSYARHRRRTSRRSITLYATALVAGALFLLILLALSGGGCTPIQ